MFLKQTCFMCGVSLHTQSNNERVLGIELKLPLSQIVAMKWHDKGSGYFFNLISKHVPPYGIGKFF